MYVNIMCIASYFVLMFMLILKIRLLMFPSRTKHLCVKLDDRAYGLSDEIKKNKQVIDLYEINRSSLLNVLGTKLPSLFVVNVS